MSAPWQWPPGGGGGGVSSFNTRTGAVVPVAGDYGSDDITNDSGVAGATVSDALDQLEADMGALDSSDVSNVSTVAGATVTAALDTLKSSIVAAQGFWHADMPRAAPTAQTDFFPAGAIAGKWGTWDPAGILSKSIDNNHLWLRATGNGSDRWCGLYQAVPSAEFAIYTKLGMNGETANFGESALFVADDIVGSPTTADFRSVEYVVGAGLNQMYTRTWASYTGGSSASTNNNAFLTPYVRLRCNGTTVASDLSLDGVNWMALVSVVLGFTPLYMGLGIDITQNGVQRGSRFKFFVCYSGAGTSGFDATGIGDLI